MAHEGWFERRSEVFCAIGDQHGGFRELMGSSNEGGFLFFSFSRRWGALKVRQTGLCRKCC